jgi:Fe-S-cluster-containing dehydrogenase component
MRGVMEKCTYCVQRLKDSVIRQKRGQKQEALVAGKPSTAMEVTTATLRIPVDSVKTACQEACPADAITFGNLLDKAKSAMGRSKRSSATTTCSTTSAPARAPATWPASRTRTPTCRTPRSSARPPSHGLRHKT